MRYPPNPGQKFRCVPSRNPRAQYHLKCNDIYISYITITAILRDTHISHTASAREFLMAHVLCGLPETKREKGVNLFSVKFSSGLPNEVYTYIYFLFKIFCAPIYRKNIAPLVDLHFTTFRDKRAVYQNYHPRYHWPSDVLFHFAAQAP